MNVLVIGSGGREHALAWKLADSPRVDRVFAAPGNAGMETAARCENIGADDFESLLGLARKEEIELVVVGPEAPLVAGIADRFRKEGIAVFGPGKEGARLEGSKDFCRSVCREAGVAVARGRTFDEYDAALEYLRKESIPVVIKADGLAAGKGVTVAETREQAEAAIKEAMVEGRFGEAGKRVVIEECLAGNEVSILAVCSGKDAVLLEPSQDHKRVFEGDRGPNTGGMGAYSPVPGFTDAQKERVRREIILPVLATLHKRGLPYRGVLYAGLMVCSGTDIRVLEFNVRFGDPETQAVLPRMQSDLFTLLDAAARGEALDPASVEWSPDACVTVVAASGGYPGAYENGKEIRGLDAGVPEKTAVFHAGTRKMEGKWLTAGGRVLAVSTMGKNLPAARRGAYRFLETIRFDGMHFRRDIAGRFDPGAGEKASS